MHNLDPPEEYFFLKGEEGVNTPGEMVSPCVRDSQRCEKVVLAINPSCASRCGHGVGGEEATLKDFNRWADSLRGAVGRTYRYSVFLDEITLRAEPN